MNKTTLSRNSSCRIVDLSDDVLIEIISRLPNKSILRFQCVSKGFCALIFQVFLSPGRKTPLPMSGLFYERGSLARVPGTCFPTIDPTLSFLPSHSTCRVIHSCNGLLLCRDDFQTQLYVCSPITKQFVSLPHLPKFHSTHAIALSFDPSQSRHYRVFHLFRPSPMEDRFELMIFYSEMGNWRKTKFMELVPIYGLLGRPVFLNGGLYILNNYNQVLCFDFKGEHFRVIKLPEIGAKWYFGCLGVSQGCLNYAENTDSELRIWVLKDCSTDNWVLKHDVCIKSLQEQQPESLRLLVAQQSSCYNILSARIFEPLALHPDLDVVFLQGVQNQILSYHLNSRRQSWEEFLNHVNIIELNGFLKEHPKKLLGTTVLLISNICDAPERVGKNS
ncbi:F-box protein At5g07610-like isoform X2 [Tasmannia lanceolata]|uniref:F-box protein At5g07610-like isoform X2 n=1 Tax=Tasmannia lanceolata TaxID=3420 RepID=UPI0040645FAD